MEFRIEDLTDRTRILYDIQKTMREDIFERILSSQMSEIEDMLLKSNVYSLWGNILQEKLIAQMIPEIFIDSNSSILFGCFGLFKYAYMCMRSELETALRLVFFRDHPMEFKWWLVGKIWWPGGNSSHVWGKDYTYFRSLEKIKMFDDACLQGHSLFKEKNNKIKRSYKLLSNYIHTGAKNFQTSPNRISPSYNLGKFNIWVETWKTVESQVNILLALGFYEELKRQTPDIYTAIKNSIDPLYHTILDGIFT